MPEHRWKGSDFGRLPSPLSLPVSSDAPASLLVVVRVPKFTESDKNKADVLLPRVPSDALRM